MYRLSSTFYAAFAGFALFNCTLLVCVSPAHAQGEIQKEVPQWTNAVPVWNDTAIWAREQHNDPSQDTAFLRTQAVRGSLSARFVVQARELVAKGKYDQAIAAYKQSSRYGWVPYDEWGDLLEARNDHANALRAYREVMYGYGIVRDAKGLTVAAKSRRDWKDKTGRSLREAVAGNLLGEDLPTPGWVSPSVYMRYALLLVKNGRKEEIEEAVQVRQWCVDALDKGSGDVIKQHGWLATVFTAESVERDPSLFIAQAWTIIGLYDKTRPHRRLPTACRYYPVQKSGCRTSRLRPCRDRTC